MLCGEPGPWVDFKMVDDVLIQGVKLSLSSAWRVLHASKPISNDALHPLLRLALVRGRLGVPPFHSIAAAWKHHALRRARLRFDLSQDVPASLHQVPGPWVDFEMVDDVLIVCM
eukprot:CAMPEP_0171170464 /NCGR_PEP_ID=MMETSP0790-20130122/8726_1 /TAXON_ID=2925 /ORGANISM="Alexandrium catenella, Strain OF101" /LENGTH=113 /DNA_ID=CAMNT_0011635309 /DNA_START=265 /DNA_END=602 /DNA_ORIENTATION=-